MMLCNTCMYWDAFDDDPGPDGMPAPQEGLCLRHAPRARGEAPDGAEMIYSFEPVWPRTPGGIWCGEWKKRERDTPTVISKPDMERACEALVADLPAKSVEELRRDHHQTIPLSVEEGAEILRAFEDQYGEGQGPGDHTLPLVKRLFMAHPALRERYGWMVAAWERSET